MARIGSITLLPAVWIALHMLGCADGSGVPAPSTMRAGGWSRDDEASARTTRDAGDEIADADAGTDAPMPDAPPLLADCTGAADTTPCIDVFTAVLGRCVEELCCTGCLTGKLVCHTGLETDACGAAGGWCDPCVVDGRCEEGVCVPPAS